MKAAPSRRDQLRAQLADLKMPGALEALDDILAGLDGGTITAQAALDALLQAAIIAGIDPRCAPRDSLR